MRGGPDARNGVHASSETRCVEGGAQNTLDPVRLAVTATAAAATHAAAAYAAENAAAAAGGHWWDRPCERRRATSTACCTAYLTEDLFSSKPP